MSHCGCSLKCPSQFCKDKLRVCHTVIALSPDVAEQLMEITGGDMPSVVIDATGSLKAINSAVRYMSHGARYVSIGLQKGDTSFSHPEFRKREGGSTGASSSKLKPSPCNRE